MFVDEFQKEVALARALQAWREVLGENGDCRGFDFRDFYGRPWRRPGKYEVQPEPPYYPYSDIREHFNPYKEKCKRLEEELREAKARLVEDKEDKEDKETRPPTTRREMRTLLNDDMYDIVMRLREAAVRIEMESCGNRFSGMGSEMCSAITDLYFVQCPNLLKSVSKKAYFSVLQSLMRMAKCARAYCSLWSSKSPRIAQHGYMELVVLASCLRLCDFYAKWKKSIGLNDMWKFTPVHLEDRAVGMGVLELNQTSSHYISASFDVEDCNGSLLDFCYSSNYINRDEKSHE